MQLAWGVALAVSCVAVFTDLKERRIPNWLTVPTMVTGIVLHLMLNGLSGGWYALSGLALGFGLLLLLFLRGGFGGGDVKLLMAVGALTGPEFLFYSFLYAAICGGCLSGIILLRKKMFRLALVGITTSQVGLTGLSIPYGIPIAFGVAFECVRRTFSLF